jgi:predicted nucleic acid-binding Zn ribbon protein
MSQRDRRPGANRKDGPVRLGTILDGVLSECGLDDRLAERTLLDVWPEIVGDRVAGHVRAVDLRDGVLLLAAEHGAWRQEVTMLLPRIQQECNERFGEGTVREIRWARGFRAEAPVRQPDNPE